MKILEKSKKAALFIGSIGVSTLVFGQEIAEETPTIAIDTPIYEQMGLSSTALFTIMTLFTLVLVFFMVSMSSTTKNILKHRQSLAKKTKLPKIMLSLIGLFAASNSMAADTVAQTGGSIIPFPDNIFWAYIIADIVLIMIIIYLSGIIKGSVSEEVVFKPSRFRWKKFSKKLTNSVEIDDEASILLDHDYDGITELDNLLPPWWKYGFYATILWAIGYFFYYQVFEIGNLQEAEYLAEMEEGEREIAAYKEAHPNIVSAETVELLTDAASLANGKDKYMTNCVVCHGATGEGSVGPNLTDDFWLYGGDIKGVFTTISEGASNGMKPWKGDFPPDVIQNIASFVLQMEYVAPPTGKEPQGDKK